MGEKNGKGSSKIMGVLMVICGIAAMGSPFLMGAIMTTLIGIMLILGGISEMCISFINGWKQALLALCSGLLTVLAGFVVLRNPVLASSFFTILMVLYFISDGVLRAIASFRLRPDKGWGLALFSALMSIVLSIMLMRGWPISGIMAVGIFAGIRLLFAGINNLSGHGSQNAQKQPA